MKALVFDLDGTLIDSVYAHTLAWQHAFLDIDLAVPAWEIHRRVGLGSRALVSGIARKRNRSISDAVLDRLEGCHREHLISFVAQCDPLPGARDLLRALAESGVAHGIATSGSRADIEPALKSLAIGRDTVVIPGDAVDDGKPDPDIFSACLRQLRVAPSDAAVVGDAVWDVIGARRAGMTAIGVLTGGFSAQELYNAGCARVYADAGELHQSLDDLGIQLARQP